MAQIPKATATTDPGILSLKPSWPILAGIALAGIVLILYVHNFRAAPSVLFLSFGWISILGAGAFLWQAGLLVAAGDDGEDASFLPRNSRIDDLQAEKRSLLKAIKEVEFDHAMGKMSDFDAAQITSVYRRRALGILKELDQRQSDAEHGEFLTVAERIERDIRTRSTLAQAGELTKERAAKRRIELADDAKAEALASFKQKAAAASSVESAGADAESEEE